MSGSSSRSPVVTSTRRARSDVAVGQADARSRGAASPVAAYVGDPPGDDVGAVPGHLVAAQPQQLGGREPVAGEEALHVRGGGVAGLARVDHRDAAPGAGQDQGC